MNKKTDNFIKEIYKRWKKGVRPALGSHPDEEGLACFLEDKLSASEKEQMKAHLISCDSCAEAFATHLRLTSKTTQAGNAPEELLQWAKDLIRPESKASVLDIILKFKEKTLEMLDTTGDILMGQELMPVPLLRSRHIKDFKDEITILKDFEDIRVEVKIENKGGQNFNLHLYAKEKKTQKVIKDLRITLIRDGVELESYHVDSGRVTFEHILLGKYTVEICQPGERLASVLLDIKI
jgi:hypothetical protein